MANKTATKSKSKIKRNVQEHSTPKGKIYDKKIRPLMDKIAQICEKNKIPLLADFQIEDEHIFTSLIGGFMGGSERQFLAMAVLAPELPGAKENAQIVIDKKIAKLLSGGNPMGELMGALLGKPSGGPLGMPDLFKDPLGGLGGLLPPLPTLEELNNMPPCPNGPDCVYCKDVEAMIKAEEEKKTKVETTRPPEVQPPSSPFLEN